MGADLILTYLPIPTDVQPDWDAARTYLHDNIDSIYDRLTEFDYDQWLYPLGEDDEAGPQELLDVLSKRLDQTIESFGWRTVTGFDFRGTTFWVCGGTSWGDSPEGMDDWDTLIACAPEVLIAAGFLVEPRENS